MRNASRQIKDVDLRVIGKLLVNNLRGRIILYRDLLDVDGVSDLLEL